MANRLFRTLLLVTGVILLPPGVLAAQGKPGDEIESPEVTRLTLQGVKSVQKDELLRSIATEQSRCVSLLLKPICFFSKSPIFYKRSYLNRDELKRDVLRVRVFYFKRGFRDAEVDTTIVASGRGKVKVTLRITEGEPTVVSRVEVPQTSPVLGERALKKYMLLKRGAALNLLKLDSSRVFLTQQLWNRGYADAVVDTAIVLDSASRSAAVTVRIAPRWAARVDSITVEGNEGVSGRTIRKSLSFKPGDIYRRSDVLTSQRTLYESNLFRRATIESADPDSLKTVTVSVQEAPPRDARLSAGFNTVDFVQVAGRYINYNWFGGARRLSLDAAVGNLFASTLNGRGIFYDVSRSVIGGSQGEYFAPTYTASAEIRQPWFGSPANELALSVFGYRRSAPGIYVDRGYGTSATFTRMITLRAPASLNYRFELTAVDAGDIYFCVNNGVCDSPTLDALRRNQRLSPLSLSVSADRTDNTFSPRRGFRAQLDAEQASAYTFSDFRYNRISGEGAVFLPIGKRSVLGGHLRAGWVDALKSTAEALGTVPAGSGVSAEILHPRKRFYAGGSRSVRGYGESQLGPRVLTIPASVLRANDSTCTANVPITQCDPALSPRRDFLPRPLGGNRVAEASVEFRFPMFGAFTGATFVDAGWVAQNTNRALPRSKAAVTPGVGVRYASPVGPIRVDIGYNPKRVEVLPVVTNAMVNGQNTLVTLQQPRSYAPGSLLSRLSLHLSIGEAF